MQRIAKWDNLKFILILLVVVGHFIDIYASSSATFQIIQFFIYSFHMPLFIFVSGLFAKKTINADHFDFGKVLPYFILALAVKAMFYFLKLALNIGSGFSMLKEGGLPWYLIAVGAWMVITRFIRKLSPVYVLTASVFVGLIAGLDNDINAYLCLSRILVFFPYFLLGYYFSPDKVLAFVNRKAVKIAAVFVVIAGILVAYYFVNYEPFLVRPMFTGQNPYSSLKKDSGYGILIRAGAYVFSTVMSVAITALVPNRQCFITKLGARTLPVYAFHYTIVYIVSPQCVDLLKVLNTHSVPFAPYIYLAIGVATTFFFTLPIFDKAVNIVFRPRRRGV